MMISSLKVSAGPAVCLREPQVCLREPRMDEMKPMPGVNWVSEPAVCTPDRVVAILVNYDTTTPLGRQSVSTDTTASPAGDGDLVIQKGKSN